MFGTFQPELNTPNYGITTPPDSYNPVYLVFHEFIAIWKDLKEAESWRDWFFILFASPAEQARVEKENKEKTREAAAVQASTVSDEWCPPGS